LFYIASKVKNLKAIKGMFPIIKAYDPVYNPKKLIQKYKKLQIL